MKRFLIVAVVAFYAVAGFVANAACGDGEDGSEHSSKVMSHKDLIPGAFASKPANADGVRLLTMEETFLSRELSPQLARFVWVENEEGFEPVEVKAEGRGAGHGGPRDRERVPEGAEWSCFTRDNGLYLRYADGTVTTLAEDEDSNIVYGQSVSRNEFGIWGGIFISPDSTKIAFYRKDESRVTSFPLLDIKTRTGELEAIKYPMAGMDSEVLRLCVYDFATRDTLHLKVSDFGADRYLTNVTWSPDSRYVFIQVLDRTQKHCRLNVYEAETGDFVQTVLTEDNEKYVEPLDPLYFLEGSNDSFIYRTANRDGYRNLYLCDPNGNITRLTAADADVEYVGNDGEWVYYMSAEVSPIENHLFRVNVQTGETGRLTKGEGWHYVDFSPDYKYFTDSYSSLNNPGTVELRTTEGGFVRTLDSADDPTKEYAYGEIVMGTVRSADGAYDNYYRVVLPADFDPSQKYPMIVYVYGGPHSQMVNDTYLAQLRRWEMYMAERGYVLYIQDNRGTSNRGLAYEQAIHRQCGQAEMADQMVGVRMMMGLPFIDSERVGVHGWSYGGFMTISLATNYPEVFKVAVAGGPVIDWKWYEVMYGERYMDRPQDNAEGYELTSLINKAADLKGKLLICQGAVDNTVVWQNSLSFVQECINNGIQVDYFPYPTAQHNMFGRERVHLHYKITEYFDLFL
ncbi:MAG: S9 family peptidase [Bacteroidales bacterium]|nr:S9 family peptidase [Bacteroidales bacterium]